MLEERRGHVKKAAAETVILNRRNETMALEPHERLFVALDTPDRARAVELARRLRGHVGGFKVGLELFSAHGPALAIEIARSAPLFLDLKFHDIPNTVAGAVAAASRLGARFLTLHATGGVEMLRRGVEAAEAAARKTGEPRPALLAVTVLTSHSPADLAAMGLAGPPRSAVLRLARLAAEAGVDGLVCSALEVEAVRGVFGPGTLIVPGIRPAGGSVGRDDQARTATPARAIELGADRLVVGRPITQADDPVAAARAITDEIERATAETGG
jgi:orotidine-5'-phosphate decarboxylase